MRMKSIIRLFFLFLSIIFALSVFDVPDYNNLSINRFQGEEINVLNTSDDGNEIILPVGRWPHGLFVADLNNDSYNDIVTSNEDHDNLSIYLHRGNHPKF